MAPNTLETGDRQIELRPMSENDRDAIVHFARALPPHDLLFLQRDIRNPKVVDAWIDQIGQGQISSLVAEENGQIVGCNAMVRDEFSWSSHVCDIRILVAPECRGIGLGRLLALHCLDRARTAEIEKLTVKMTPDQTGALKLFEEMGFRPEALLRDEVRDAAGKTCDIVILALEVARHLAQHQAFGLNS